MPTQSIPPIALNGRAEYLGDGLIADFDNWRVKLYDARGHNTVELEPLTLQLFLAWLYRTKPEVFAYISPEARYGASTKELHTDR